MIMLNSYLPAELVDPADIKPVAGHVSTCYDRLILIWGGYYEDEEQGDRPTVYNHPKYLLVFDTETSKWFRFTTNGPHPEENSGCCGILVDYMWYIFGGFYESADTACELRALNLRTLVWCHIQPTTNIYPTPRHKFVGWEYRNKLYFFGGFGPPSSTLIKSVKNREYLDDNVKFVQDPSSGDVPSARAAHAAVKLKDGRVVLFGGRHMKNRLNDLYVLNLKNFQWIKVISTVSPPERSWHTLTYVDDNCVVLFGGFTQERKPLNDLWLLNTNSMAWAKVSRDTKSQQRLWHTAACIKGRLYVFGGCKSDILAHNVLREFTNEMFSVDLSPQSLLRLCLEFCMKRKSKRLLCNFPATVMAKANIEAGYSLPKMRTPLEILSL